MRRIFWILSVFLFLVPALLYSQSQPTNPAILYVTTTGLDSNNGLTWQTAKATNAAAIASCPVTGCTIYDGDGNYTITTQITDSGIKPVVLHLGRGTYSTSLALPFLMTHTGSSVLGAKTTDGAGGTTSGTLIDYTGSSQMNFMEFGSDTSAFYAGGAQNLSFNFGSAAAGSNGILAWGAVRSQFFNIMQTTSAGVQTVSGEVDAVGDGTTTTFTYQLAHYPVIEYEPNKASGLRLSVTAGSVTGEDQGDGTISGTGITGTVGYSNGEISVTFSTAPAAATNITTTYSDGDYLVALLSTEEDLSGLRVSPLNFELRQINGRDTRAKVLVQGEATGGSGGNPSYAQESVIKDADGGQFEINWSNQILLLRDSTDSNVPGSPNPAFSFIEDTSAFFIAGSCGTQTDGVSYYLSTTANMYFLSDACAGAPPLPGGTTPAYVQLPESTFVKGTGDESTSSDGQLLGTLNIAALTQGNTAQGPFTPQSSWTALLGPLIPPGASVPIVQQGKCGITDFVTGTTTCTIDLTSPTIAGDTLILTTCATEQTGCFSGAMQTGYPQDSGGDTFVLGNHVWTATNIVAGSTTVTCGFENAVYTEAGSCIVVEVSNFAGIDVSAETLSSAASTDVSATTTSSLTTNHADETVLGFVANPNPQSACYGSVESDSYSTNAGLGGDIITSIYADGGTQWMKAVAFGAASTGTYSLQSTIRGWIPYSGCPGVYGGNVYVLLVALEPTTPGPVTHFPTWRYITMQDLGASGIYLPSGTSVNPQYQWVYTGAYGSGTLQVQRPMIDWTSGVSCSDDAANLITLCSATGGFTNPMTTLGDTIYGGTSGAATRLAGNTTTTPMLFTQTGTGSASAAPAWNSLGALGIPTISGTPTTGNCVDWASASTLGDAGAACGSGGIPSGTLDQLLYYASSGTTVTPLTLGTNLSISGGVLNASGGGSPAGSAYATQYNNSGSFGGTGPGTAGYVLTSNGSSAAPTFQAASSGTTSAQANTVQAGPIKIPGTTAVIVNKKVCVGPLGAVLPSCDVGTVAVGDFLTAYYEYGTDSVSTCTLSSSLSNSWSQFTATGGSTTTVGIFYMTATAAGDEVVTPSSGCATSIGSGENSTFIVLNWGPSATSIDAASGAPDTLTTPETLSVTTTYAKEPVVLFSSDSQVGDTYVLGLSAYPQLINIFHAKANPSYNVSIGLGDSSGGTKDFTFYSDGTTSWLHEYAVAVVPSGAIVGTAPTTCTGTVTTCAATQAATVGEKIFAVMMDISNGITNSTCTGADNLGNSYATDESSTAYMAFEATVTVAGTPTFTFTSCGGTAATTVASVFVVRSGYSFYGFRSQNPTTTMVDTTTKSGQVNVILTSNVASTGPCDIPSSYYYTPISTQCSATPTVWIGEAIYPTPTSQTVTASGVGYAATDWSITLNLVPTTQPTYPMTERKTVNTDINPPQLVIDPIPAGTSSVIYDGSQYGGWTANLSANITTASFSGMQDGQTYSWNFCQPSSGGYSVSWPSNTVNPPLISTTASACTTVRGIWSAYTQEMLFHSAFAAAPFASPADPAEADGYSNAGVTTLPTTAGINVAVGNNTALVFVGTLYASQTTTSVTDTAGNTCTQIGEGLASATTWNRVYSCPITIANSSDIFTVTYGASTGNVTILVLYYTNVRPTLLAPASFASGTPVDMAPIYSYEGDMGVVVSEAAGLTSSPGTGWTAYSGMPSNFAAEYAPVSSTATLTPQWASLGGSTTNYYVSFTIALRSYDGSVAGPTTAIAANTCGDSTTYPVGGATTSMGVTVTPQTALGSGLIIDSGTTRVSAANTVTVGYCNITTGSLTPAASNLNVRIQQ